MKFPNFANIVDRMRADWDTRARKDAHFYVAFGRQSQSEQEFIASAAEVMPALQEEFPRLPASSLPTRALEIGCGPGRLLLPMSQHFTEVHGVDISEQMIALARERLAQTPNAHLHVTSGADLAIFEDGFFDFVYSYIVFQHIPDRAIVLNYLREAQRVLKPGGVLRCQIRGTAPLASELPRESETWTGCYFSAAQIARFAREQAFPLVALSGLDTQYMWTTFRKPLEALKPYLPERIAVKDVTAASGPGSRVPARGRDAAISLWIDGMPESASLADLPVYFEDRAQLGCYLSPVSECGGCQLDARLPEGIAEGPHRVQLTAEGEPAGEAHQITVMPAPPSKPRVVSVVDGINTNSRCRVETGGAQVTVEDLPDPARCSFAAAGRPVDYLQHVCIDPITSTYTFSFDLKPDIPAGRIPLRVSVDGQELETIAVEVVR